MTGQPALVNFGAETAASKGIKRCPRRHCNDDDDDDDINFGSAGIDMKACKILAQLISILAGCFS